jgi:hypothetical protein
MLNLQQRHIIKHRRKSLRKIVVYNIGTNVIDYVKVKYNALQRSNKVAPIENTVYDLIYLP